MIKLSKILLLIILIIILTTSSIFADTSLPMPNDYAIVDAFIVNCFNNDDKNILIMFSPTNNINNMEYLVKIKQYNSEMNAKWLVNKNISITNDKPIAVIEFKNTNNPVEIIIYRQNRERTDLSLEFKENFIYEYKQNINSKDYYFYRYYNSITDGKTYPSKMLFENMPKAEMDNIYKKYKLE